ncbi:MAG: prepilin-type N-terminal cleavage/methylation domain-containing protein [Agathobacter sp.]|nr:prepilin-type N-terminal cleavage/methylation domain-containing protein [Agathobacter sp.]
MKKLMNKKGFTLMEMLIVVAIIVILVAIAIPTFTGQLNNAKEAVDDANLRGAKGIAANMYMLEGETGDLYYDAENGALVDSPNGIEGYGQLESGKIIKVTIGTDGSISTTWVAATTTPSTQQ